MIRTVSPWLTSTTTTNKMRFAPEYPIAARRGSSACVCNCRRRPGSSNTARASWKVTPCLATLLAAFAGSQEIRTLTESSITTLPARRQRGHSAASRSLLRHDCGVLAEPADDLRPARRLGDQNGRVLDAYELSLHGGIRAGVFRYHRIFRRPLVPLRPISAPSPTRGPVRRRTKGSALASTCTCMSIDMCMHTPHHNADANDHRDQRGAAG